MKKAFLSFLITCLTLSLSAQETGKISGTVFDKDAGNSPLPFANVTIQGTSKGATTDFDGLYTIDLAAGTYQIVFSFIGYTTVTVPVTVKAGETINLNQTLSASEGVALEDVTIKAAVSKEKESALLLEQKKAVEIKESIGAATLSKLGVSDVSTATTKISGVNKTDGSGDIFVRGLGDRYLYTTLNGLPIPSDNVDKKNIDLSLFPTRLIQNVSVSKTVSPNSSTDQASGNIDITSKILTGNKKLSVNVASSVNSNVANSYDNFLVSPNQDDVKFGFYNANFLSTQEAITQQSWQPRTESNPVNRSFALSAGKRFGDKWKVMMTVGQGTSYDYREGYFKQFRENYIDDTIPDANTWKKTVNTSGLIDVNFKVSDNVKLQLNTLLINKVEDNVFEGGRAMTATIFEEDDRDEDLWQFIRDQNLKKTLLSVTQLHTDIRFSDRFKSRVSIGFNNLDADEPNRIRNEINFSDSEVLLAKNGGFQQRKSQQLISDTELGALVKNNIILFEDIDVEKSLKLDFGANIRLKERDFSNLFVGVDEKVTYTVNPESIDLLSEVFTEENFSGDNAVFNYKIQAQDRYIGNYNSYAGYANVTFGTEIFTIQGGLRFQSDEIKVNYDVNNDGVSAGTFTLIKKHYNRVYPAINLKYNLNENNSLRLSGSLTQTLPEFKEIAPFEYVSPTGQVTKGNPDLIASTNYNLDIKWEFFPSRDELLSFTTFYKRINDPINRTMTRGSAGVFSYFNTADRARIFGLEMETRYNIIKGEDQPNLRVSLNASRMWHTQDLKTDNRRTFKFYNLSETGLQGASDWIVNGSLTLTTPNENPWNFALSTNYASDKIFSLGGPEDQQNFDRFFNHSIIEKGYVVLDFVMSKQFNKHFSMNVSGKNLLNPEIKRTQIIDPLDIMNNGEVIEITPARTETVLRYTRGAQYSVGFKYVF